MPTAIVTGSGGLIGCESVQHFIRAAYDVIGLENDMRARLFGPAASTADTTRRLQARSGGAFRSLAIDLRPAGTSRAKSATCRRRSTIRTASGG